MDGLVSLEKVIGGEDTITLRVLASHFLVPCATTWVSAPINGDKYGRVGVGGPDRCRAPFVPLNFGRSWPYTTSPTAHAARQISDTLQIPYLAHNTLLILQLCIFQIASYPGRHGQEEKVVRLSRARLERLFRRRRTQGLATAVPGPRATRGPQQQEQMQKGKLGGRGGTGFREG